MNQSEQMETLSAIADKQDHQEQVNRGVSLASVRVSPGPYLGLASVATFFSALLLRSGQDALALALIALTWLIVPILAFTDRIVFDGHYLRRQGPLVFLLSLLAGYKKQLAVDDFETVETHAVRTLRRGGTVRYRYRTQINGKGKEFVITSGGKNYRKLVRTLFPLIHADKLDTRTRDLRDYLNEPRFVDKKTKLTQLAPSSVLERAKDEVRLDATSKAAVGATPEDIERAHLLRRLGNELRVAGRLREAGEAFRRALNVTPKAPWLIYDFARLLRSQASAESDAKLLSRSRAALRLGIADDVF